MASGFGKVLAWLFVILILVGSVGAIAYLTGGFKEEVNIFYVVVEDKEVTTTDGGYLLSKDDTLSVAVKYRFVAEDTKGYTVKVIPNVLPDKDFDFSLNGEVYSYQAEKDLTKGFNIQMEEDSFTISPKGNLVEVMQAIYPGNEVEILGNGAYEDMFLLVITSYDGESSVTISFAVLDAVRGITLHPSHIIF